MGQRRRLTRGSVLIPVGWPELPVTDHHTAAGASGKPFLLTPGPPITSKLGHNFLFFFLFLFFFSHAATDPAEVEVRPPLGFWC